MKSTSVASVRGFIIWLILTAVIGAFCWGISSFLGVRNYTDLAMWITGPIVCPFGTTARIDVVPSTYADANGYKFPALSMDFNCIDSKGTITATKTWEQNSLWVVIVPVASFIVGGLLSLIILRARSMPIRYWSFPIVLLVAFVFASRFVLPVFNAWDTSISPFSILSGSTIIQGDPSNPFQVNIQTIPPNLDSDSQKLELKINNINYNQDPSKTDEHIEGVCIEEILIYLRIEQNRVHTTDGWNGEGPINFLGPGHEICQSIQTPYNRTIFMYPNPENNPGPLSAFAFVDNDPFFYPYDGLIFKFVVLLKYHYLYNQWEPNQTEITEPYTDISNEGNIEWFRTNLPPDPSFTRTYWLLNQETWRPYYDFIQKVPLPQTIQYSRPLVIRLVYPVLILSLLIFIAFLATADSYTTFIEGTVAVMFGIYGIRQVIFPPNIQIRTFNDIFILGLYVTFAAALLIQVIRFFSRPALSRTTPKVIDAAQANSQTKESKTKARSRKDSSSTSKKPNKITRGHSKNL